MNPQCYYTLASYYKIISDQNNNNNLLAFLLRYHYSSSNINGTCKRYLHKRRS